MNFFNSIFADDPEPTNFADSPETDHTDAESETPDSPNPNPSSDSTPRVSNSGWDFGNLIKNIASRSESVIKTYRQDMEEFRTGLIKETTVIRDVAGRAVREFPDSIDTGAAKAQRKLESMGEVIDTLGSSVWKGAAEIVAHSKELHLFDDDDDDDTDNVGQLNERKLNLNVGELRQYSRFEMRMREIQCDSRTYVEDPDDEEYMKWKLGFVLDDKGEEIMNLMGENRVVERFYLELVPVKVDRETFWSRYFYKVYKLEQAEEARARIVKRAISGEDDEELSWDVDDEEEEKHKMAEDKNRLKSKDLDGNFVGESSSELKNVENSPKRSLESESDDNGSVKPASDDVQEGKVNENKVSEGKIENAESCKDSDVSVISTQPSMPGEEESGWDEIEYIESDDEQKTTPNRSANIADLCKRLSAAEEEEDLSWDIEDDDEPVKS